MFSPAIFTLFLSVLSLSAVNARAAEVDLRTSANTPQFRVKASVTESAAEVAALARLAHGLEQPGADLNRLVAGSSVLVPSPERVAGLARSSDEASKYIYMPVTAQTHLVPVDVLDHYENETVIAHPVYRSEMQEKEVAGSAE